MLKPSEQEKREFANLRNGAVQTHLIRCLEAAKDVLVGHADADVLRRTQGRAQLARELLELIDPQGFSTNGKRG